MSKFHAVLTGDLIGSTRMSAEDLARARSAVEMAVAAIQHLGPSVVIGWVEFYRGDAWQVLLGDPGCFLRAALTIRASLRQHGFDSRIAIGLGTVEKVDQNRISLSTGEAFTLSGRALDKMAGAPGFSFDAPKKLLRPVPWVGPMLDLCDALVSRVTPGRAFTVFLVLVAPNMSQKDIARERRISPQAVSDALSAIGWSALQGALAFMERYKWESGQWV